MKMSVVHNMKREKESFEEYTRKLADYGVVFDVMESLALSRSENEIISKIIELFENVCAPSCIAFLPINEGTTGKVKTTVINGKITSEITDRLASFNSPEGWKELDSGFIIHILYHDEPVGVLEVSGIAFPEHKGHYLNLALNVVNVFGLCISNARNYETLEEQVSIRTNELLEANIELKEEVAERRRAEKEKSLFKKLINNSSDTIVIADPESGQFLDVNDAMCEALGYTREEILKLRVVDIDADISDVATWMTHIKELKKEEVLVFESRHKREDGTIFPVEINVKYIFESGQNYLVAIVRNITERKRIEDEIIEAKVKAEEATKLKDKFVSLVSHDLQSPLATMLGFLKLLRDDEAEVPNEGVKHILAGAIDTGNKMSALINDLLSISRLRTGALKPNLAFFDAKRIGLKMIADFEFLAQKKGIKIFNKIPSNSRLYGDISLLTETVQNLITNSLKYCNKGDSITIFVPDFEKSTICVQDTGVGVKAELQDKIFEYGEKVSKTGTAGEIGTGLGLPFAKEMVESHDGTLTLESEEGKGCLVKIKLPFVRPRILLVDDEPEFRLLLNYYLKTMEVDIVEAENGVEAINEVEKKMPHLIISDIEMPVMNGLELVRRLQNGGETKSIPVIVVSGEHGVEIRDEVFGSGAKDFITKSSTEEELIPRVRRYIS